MRHALVLRNRARGISLVESLMTTTIVTVLLGLAAPDFVDQAARRRVESLAAQLETDIQLARTEAVQRSQTVRMSFARDAQGSCYVLHTGGAGDCGCDSAGHTVCTAGVQTLRVVGLPRGDVERHAGSPSFLIDAVGGTVTPTATLRLVSPAGSLHQVVNIMGRVRSCTPDGRLAGHRRC